jgi:hypothetical protein
MTHADLEKALRESAEEVLETMFFAAVLGDAAEPAPEDRGGAARVAFSGAPPGVCTVAACPAAARSLAAAFLGIDESEVSAGGADEVMRELANMICGSTLSRLAPDAPFELRSLEGAPDPDAPAPRSHAAPGARCTLDIGAGALALSVETGV